MSKTKRANSQNPPAPQQPAASAPTPQQPAAPAPTPRSGQPRMPGAIGAVANSMPQNGPQQNQGWWGATKSWAGRNIGMPLVYGLEYSGLGNVVKGVGTTARGLANTAGGGIGAGLGAVFGGLATAGGYATDALGRTENAGQNNWEGTKAFVGAMGNAAYQGAKDTLGGAADTATFGLYNYDGSLLDPKQTAVQHMHNEHVNQLSNANAERGDLNLLPNAVVSGLGMQNRTVEDAKNLYGTSTAIGEGAADLAAGAGVGTGVSAGVKGVKALAGVAPAATAATRATPLMYTPVSQVPAALAQSTPLQAAGLGAGAALEHSAVQGNKEEVLDSMFPQGTAEGSDFTDVDIKSQIPEYDTLEPEQRTQLREEYKRLTELPEEQKQTAATALSDPESPEAQQLATAGQQNYVNENMPNAPADPNQFGGFMNTMMERFNAMPMEAKIGMGLGLAGGLIGLMGSLSEGGLGNFLLAGLGLAGAGVAAGTSGLLGDDAQKFLGDSALGIGRAMGMKTPEKRDLSALLADDPIAAARGQAGDHGLGFFSSPDAVQSVIDDAEATRAEKLQQLEQLQAVPTFLRPSVLRSLDPENIKTVEDANLAANNAQNVYRQLQNPESDANRDIDEQLEYARKKRDQQRWNPFAWAGRKKTSALVRGINKYAFNAMDAKELHDLKNEQHKKYNLDNARRLNELSMRQQYSQGQRAKSPCAKLVRGPVVRSISITVLRKAARCWAGYEPVPGAKAYSRGSCRPVGSKKTQKEMKKT